MAATRLSFLILVLSVLVLFPDGTSSGFLGAAFKGLKNMFMQDRITSNPDDVGFYLYPNPNDLMDTDKLIFGNVRSYRKSRLQPDLPFVFLIHGFTQNYTTSFPQDVKDAYLQNGYGEKLNIIAVDWGKLSFGAGSDSAVDKIFFLPAYDKASNNVLVVGQRVENFILDLMHKGYLVGGGDRIHLIGFSLGSHVAGVAARHFGEDREELIYRVTGLDPAGPSFKDAPMDARLNSRIAQFVDVVHTNGKEFGFYDPLGDIDFYVNGGAIQPHCVQRTEGKPLKPVQKVKIIGECSHNSAHAYYAESIRNKKMKGCPGMKREPTTVHCDPWKQVVFGENCPPGSKGTYFIQILLKE